MVTNLMAKSRFIHRGGHEGHEEKGPPEDEVRDGDHHKHLYSLHPLLLHPRDVTVDLPVLPQLRIWNE